MYNLQNIFETARSLIFGPHHLPCPSPSCNNPYKAQTTPGIYQIYACIVSSIYHIYIFIYVY